MKPITSYAFVILGAFFYHLGHPNHFDFLFPLGSIIGMSIFLTQLIPKQSLKSRALKLLSFNLFITLISFYWIAKTLQEFGALPLPVALIANSLYALIFQPQFWFIIIGLTFIEKKKKIDWNSSKNLFIFAIILTLTEYYTPQQFPVFLSHPLITWSENLGLASVFGLPLFSFMSYLICLEIFRYQKFKSYSLFHIGLVIIFIALNPLLAHKKTTENISPANAINIRMVQPNISNFLKVSSEQGGYASTSYVLGQYKELSLLPFKENQPIDLIIWPETAYPYPVNTNKKSLGQTQLPFVVNEVNALTNAHILFGGFEHLKDAEDASFFKTEYNAAFFTDRGGVLKDTYQKHILIPFGETLPFGPLNKWVGSFIQNISFFAAGEKYPIFKTDNNTSFMTTICYELLKPEFIREYFNSLGSKPDYMINLTNDSWYGNTLEPEQHLFLARWRAIEFDIPLLRSTNTGVTTLISANGQEVTRLEYDVKGNLDLTLPAKRVNGGAASITLFQRYGIWNSVVLWFLCLIFHSMLLKFYYDKKS